MRTGVVIIAGLAAVIGQRGIFVWMQRFDRFRDHDGAGAGVGAR